MCVLYISKTELTISQPENSSIYTHPMIWLVIIFFFQLPRPKPLCISYTLLHNPQTWQFKTYMYYLSVAVGEESGHGLAGPSALGFLTGCNHSISRHCGLISKLQRGRTRPELTWLLAGFDSSRVVALRASIPCWLLARGCPQILAMWTLLHWSVQAERATERICQQEEIIIFCSLITEVPFHRLCHILVIRYKSLGPT